MNFNTAIYYDIENLIGGYGASKDEVEQVSLKKILKEIKAIAAVGPIAIQKAYANWSDPRLSSLRKDMIELGIEPVQMIGFGHGPNKNASDLHLAIDVIECALTRGFVQTFVIVSGDGGFASLAKKLHEYNRFVIGCGYKKSSNQVFKGLCDEFIWLNEPKANVGENAAAPKIAAPLGVQSASAKVTKQTVSEPKVPVTKPGGSSTAVKVPKTQDSVFKKLLDSMDLEALQNLDTPLQQIEALFKGFIAMKEVKRDLNSKGLSVTKFQQLIALYQPRFKVQSCGFGKFNELIRHLGHRVNVDVLHLPPSDSRLVSKGRKLPKYQLLVAIPEAPDVHSRAFYTRLLTLGSPALHLPIPGNLQLVLECLERDAMDGKTMTEEELIQTFAKSSGVSVRQATLVFQLLKEANFYYLDSNRKDATTPGGLISRASAETKFKAIMQLVEKKISDQLGRCDQNLLKGLFDEDWTTQTNSEGAKQETGGNSECLESVSCV